MNSILVKENSYFKVHNHHQSLMLFDTVRAVAYWHEIVPKKKKNPKHIMTRADGLRTSKKKASRSPCPLGQLSITCFRECPFLRSYYPTYPS